jgi:hypothetical protein
MVDVRNLVEQAVEVVARAAEPVAQAAAESADVGVSIAVHGRQVSEAVTDALVSALRSLPDKLRELEVPRAKHSLADVADQLGKIAVRLRRLSGQLGLAGSRLSEPALRASGQLVVDGFVAAASGARLLRPSEGLIRWLPRSLARPYVDGITTVQLGLSTAGDLTRLCVNALPDLGQGLREIADDLGRASELLEATGKTVRELSELVPI